jgi:hypothetical protein
MAVEGDLKDISLINLIQMICQQGSKAALFLKRDRERGMLFFEHGEIIHASSDAVEGVEAVYRLLGWTNGAFRMSPYSEVPRRTVKIPWGQIVLEGIRMVDEERAKMGAEVEKILSSGELQQDAALENNLTYLLSRLEHSRAQLAEGKISNRPMQALALLAEMVNEVVAFSEKQPFSDGYANSLAKILDQVGGKNPRAHLLQAEHNRLAAQTVSNLYKNWNGDAYSRRQTFQQVAGGIVAVQELYFSLLINHFHAAAIAKSWKETADLFLTDLGQVVNEIQF